ncbi:MAG: hypothetical protein Q7S98_01615 [Deltaproteobacteria bacterium]|nr:hypothetical protein [Deltaproteobacteria bacterium]
MPIQLTLTPIKGYGLYCVNKDDCNVLRYDPSGKIVFSRAPGANFFKDLTLYTAFSYHTSIPGPTSRSGTTVFGSNAELPRASGRLQYERTIDPATGRIRAYDGELSIASTLVTSDHFILAGTVGRFQIPPLPSTNYLLPPFPFTVISNAMDQGTGLGPSAQADVSIIPVPGKLTLKGTAAQNTHDLFGNVTTYSGAVEFKPVAEVTLTTAAGCQKKDNPDDPNRDKYFAAQGNAETCPSYALQFLYRKDLLTLSATGAYAVARTNRHYYADELTGEVDPSLPRPPTPTLQDRERIGDAVTTRTQKAFGAALVYDRFRLAYFHQDTSSEDRVVTRNAATGETDAVSDSVGRTKQHVVESGLTVFRTDPGGAWKGSVLELIGAWGHQKAERPGGFPEGTPLDKMEREVYYGGAKLTVTFNTAL